jgi:hypothetical protein
MAVLTLSQIDDLCQELLVPQPNYNSQIIDYFRNMYATGCRPAELFDVSKWSYDGVSVFELQPLKGNLPRYFNASVLTSYFKDTIINNGTLYPFTTLRKQRYYNQKFRSVPQVFNLGKEVENYLFRYRYVKQLAADGEDNLTITAIMGWNDSTIVNLYKFANLYTP